MNFKAPRLTYEDIRIESENFLKEYHPSGEIPIPIEYIADCKIGINIVPIPNLYRSTSVNGYLSSDQTCIFVDQTQYDQYDTKFRFTVAHEVGHYVLHKECYENIDWNDEKDYYEFYSSVDPHEMGWFETQGNWFAAQVLVPQGQLREVCYNVVKERAKDLEPLGELSPNAWEYLSNDIAKPFNVAPMVVQLRIQKENIDDEIKLKDFL